MSTPVSLTLPDCATARTLSTARGAFAALDARPPAGPAEATSVLVPGFTGSKEDFLGVLEPLTAAGFRVVTYDQRGQHETKAGPPPEGWSLAAFAADLQALVEALDVGPVHLVGHSFGGLVAREAVLADPTPYRSLVLLDSGPAAVDARQSELLVRMADGLDGFGLTTVWSIKRSLDLEQGWQPPEDPEVEAFLERRFLGNDPAGLAAIARLLASAPDRSDELAATALPKLVAYGEADDAWPAEIQARTASRIGATAVSFPDAAHSPAAESPKATAAALVAFWGKTGAAG
jgi:pimeloyl-ACP methyl ester carboxylesterase